MGGLMRKIKDVLDHNCTYTINTEGAYVELQTGRHETE